MQHIWQTVKTGPIFFCKVRIPCRFYQKCTSVLHILHPDFRVTKDKLHVQREAVKSGLWYDKVRFPGHGFFFGEESLEATRLRKRLRCETCTKTTFLQTPCTHRPTQFFWRLPRSMATLPVGSDWSPGVGSWPHIFQTSAFFFHLLVIISTIKTQMALPPVPPTHTGSVRAKAYSAVAVGVLCFCCPDAAADSS